MNVEDMNEGTSEFERHVRELLNDSVEHMPAAARSRLTQARYAALAARPFWQRSLVRHWAPAGAAAVLAVLLLVAPRGEHAVVSPLASAMPEDLELLADGDALQLSKDQDLDADFYEWAAGEAQGAPAPSLGT
jgi:hypothetical protein